MSTWYAQTPRHFSPDQMWSRSQPGSYAKEEMGSEFLCQFDLISKQMIQSCTMYCEIKEPPGVEFQEIISSLVYFQVTVLKSVSILTYFKNF